jgi:hypothetical protein
MTANYFCPFELQKLRLATHITDNAASGEFALIPDNH